MATQTQSDPRHHTRKMQERLQETIEHLRQDIVKVDATPAQGDVRDVGRGPWGPQEGFQRLRAEDRSRVARMSQEHIFMAGGSRRRFLKLAGQAT